MLLCLVNVWICDARFRAGVSQAWWTQHSISTVHTASISGCQMACVWILTLVCLQQHFFHLLEVRNSGDFLVTKSLYMALVFFVLQNRPYENTKMLLDDCAYFISYSNPNNKLMPWCVYDKDHMSALQTFRIQVKVIGCLETSDKSLFTRPKPSSPGA